MPCYSAWADANQLALNQVATAEKSNEITAIPKLFELLELTECVTTLDAMGCQKAIAEQIVVQGADYVLAVVVRSERLSFGAHSTNGLSAMKLKRKHIRAVNVTAKRSLKMAPMGAVIHNIIVKPVVLTAYLIPGIGMQRKTKNVL